MKISFLRPLALTSALALGMLGHASAVEYTSLDSAASSVGFGYSQMGVKMDGNFGRLNATQLQFNPEHPTEARITIEVALASVDAGYAEANEELEKDEWLALAAHPLATFTSSQVQALGSDRFEVTGDLSIKGVTKQVTAPFTFQEDGDAGIFEGSFVFQRADFGVGEGQWKDFSIVANDIRIDFHVVARP